MANIDTVKQWFMTKKKPTQAQFWSLFGMIWFKDQSIPMGNIENLTSTLNAIDAPLKQTKTFAFADASNTKTFVIPIGYVVRNVVVESAAAQNVRIGDTDNGTEILNDLAVGADSVNDISVGICSTRAATRTIYMNSSAGDITVTITYTKFFKA